MIERFSFDYIDGMKEDRIGKYVEYKDYLSEIELLKHDLKIILEQEEKRQGFTDAVMDENNKLNIENKQLREVLKKCDPYVIWNDFDDEYGCFSCNSYIDESHDEDCEYIRLTRGKK